MKRNIFKLIAKLLNLVGSFIFVLILAIFNGVLGNLLAINITFFCRFSNFKTFRHWDYIKLSINLYYHHFKWSF